MKTIKAFRVSITQRWVRSQQHHRHADFRHDNRIAKGIIKCIFLKKVTPLFVVIKVKINSKNTYFLTESMDLRCRRL
ncbi:hypothetical protein [Paludibacterium purpuratum]|uniref:hypothetical protein n=1 Tax=Paludibacterium purpuratum TaxID=1144873 RepID=UPI0014153075|nr:hypothetical protein [Paludibacterium purpuratum]